MKLVTWKQLVERFGKFYSRQHFERLGRAGTAPVRRKFRNRAVWVEAEVEAWIAKQFAPVQTDLAS